MTVADEISRIIVNHLNPLDFEVVNESELHAGHAGDDGSGESHFRLVVVSEKFEGISRVECHRMVYNLLQSNLEKMPHALSIKASSPK